MLLLYLHCRLSSPVFGSPTDKSALSPTTSKAFCPTVVSQAVSIEGLSTSQWILMDFGDVVVHVFRSDIREHYGLEKLWSDARVRLPAQKAAETITLLLAQPRRERRARNEGKRCFGPLFTLFLIIASVLYSYFRDLNPGSVSIRLESHDDLRTHPVSLMVLSMAIGALIVILFVGVRETRHLILTWRSVRLRRREEKVKPCTVKAHTHSSRSGRPRRSGYFKSPGPRSEPCRFLAVAGKHLPR